MCTRRCRLQSLHGVLRNATGVYLLLDVDVARVMGGSGAEEVDAVAAACDV